ncbi:MAG: hypothetical protein ACJ741_05900 [Pyrinomonadaceae bacterium]
MSHLAYPLTAAKIRALNCITLIKHPSSEKVTSRFRDSLSLRLAQIDAPNGWNVSASPEFSSNHCFYLQNTADADFVARIFMRDGRRVTGDGQKLLRFAFAVRHRSKISKPSHVISPHITWQEACRAMSRRHH